MNLAHVCVVIVALQVSGVVLTAVFRRRYAAEEFTALASLTLWPILVAWGLLASAWYRSGLVHARSQPQRLQPSARRSRDGRYQQSHLQRQLAQGFMGIRPPW